MKNSLINIIRNFKEKISIWGNQLEPSYRSVLRLFDGSTVNSGVVEINCNEQWGYICVDGFNQVAADSICRQLGYDSALNFSSTDV